MSDIAAIKRRVCKRALWRRVIDRVARWLYLKRRAYALRVLHLTEAEYRHCLLGILTRQSADFGMYESEDCEVENGIF